MLLGIRPLWFFGALAIGLLVCYLFTPAQEVIVKFPSPYNAGRVVYKDKDDGCFVYSADQVPCPADGAGVRPQPIHEVFTAGPDRTGPGSTGPGTTWRGRQPGRGQRGP
jgi:hypothetical protein